MSERPTNEEMTRAYGLVWKVMEGTQTEEDRAYIRDVLQREDQANAEAFIALMKREEAIEA